MFAPSRFPTYNPTQHSNYRHHHRRGHHRSLDLMPPKIDPISKEISSEDSGLSICLNMHQNMPDAFISELRHAVQHISHIESESHRIQSWNQLSQMIHDFSENNPDESRPSNSDNGKSCFSLFPHFVKTSLACLI